MKRHVLGLAGMSILAAIGCGSTVTPVGSQAPPVTEQLTSPEGRITAPATTDVSTLTSDNAAFGLDLFHALGTTDNFIDSPHSISVALAMTYAGARGTTHDEMARVMHYTLPEPSLHAAFDAVDLALNGQSTAVTDAGAQPFQLHVVDSLWGQKGYPFLGSFLDLLARYYGAGLWTVDFAADTEKARQAINQWVSSQTEAKIPELLQAGDIDAATALVLVNAIYFHASWSIPFRTTSTADGSFQKLDGSSVTVPMMHRGEETSAPTTYAESTDWQALELGYAGGAVSMVVLLPAAGQYTTFVSGLDGTTLAAILAQLGASPAGLQIALPRFQIRSRLRLKDTLSAMGMPTPFSAGADFSGIDGTGGLCISDVIHEAMIKVDEAGTEAAAATAVPLRKSASPQPVSFTADRPFLYLIRDKATGAVLFLGQVTDPSVTG